MLQRIYLWLSRLNDSTGLTWVLIVFAVLLAALTFRSAQFHVATPDREIGYEAPYIEEFFCSDAPEPAIRFTVDKCARRRFYVATQLTLDTLFPLAYGMLLGILMVMCFPVAKGKWLVLLPVLAACFDFAENLMLVWLACTWECGTDYPALFGIVPWVSNAKWLLFFASCLAVVVGQFKKGPQTQ